MHQEQQRQHELSITEARTHMTDVVNRMNSGMATVMSEFRALSQKSAVIPNLIIPIARRFVELDVDASGSNPHQCMILLSTEYDYGLTITLSSTFHGDEDTIDTYHVQHTIAEDGFIFDLFPNEGVKVHTLEEVYPIIEMLCKELPPVATPFLQKVDEEWSKKWEEKLKLLK